MTDNSKLIGQRRIDRRTGETWEVISANIDLKLKSLRSGKIKDVTVFRFEKWYVTQEAYAKIRKAEL